MSALTLEDQSAFPENVETFNDCGPDNDRHQARLQLV
jgi:hypothetical protein